MADDGFNTSAVKWPTTGDTIGNLLSIDFTDTAAAIDLTSSASSSHVYTTGISDPEVSIELIGIPANTHQEVGVSGVLTLNWASAGGVATTTIDTAVITDVSTSGSLDDRLTTTITFKAGV